LRSKGRISFEKLVRKIYQEHEKWPNCKKCCNRKNGGKLPTRLTKEDWENILIALDYPQVFDRLMHRYGWDILYEVKTECVKEMRCLNPTVLLRHWGRGHDQTPAPVLTKSEFDEYLRSGFKKLEHPTLMAMRQRQNALFKSRTGLKLKDPLDAPLMCTSHKICRPISASVTHMGFSPLSIPFVPLQKGNTLPVQPDSASTCANF